jgi:hypothetical protein
MRVTNYVTRQRVMKDHVKLREHLEWLTMTLYLAEKNIDKQQFYLAKDYLNLAQHRLEVAQITFEKLEKKYE